MSRLIFISSQLFLHVPYLLNHITCEYVRSTNPFAKSDGLIRFTNCHLPRLSAVHSSP